MSIMFKFNKNKINKPQKESHPNFLLSVEEKNTKNKSKASQMNAKIMSILSNRKKKQSSKAVKKTFSTKMDNNEITKVVNRFLNHYKNPYDLCVNVLIQFANYRNKEIIDLIKPYLKELIGLMDIISNEKNEELADKILNQIAMNLQYKKIEKNKFICKYGEKGNHFYVILKGKIVFLVPKIVKCYLNECEYITYLLKVKKSGENDLLKNLVNINRQFYDFGEDFDNYIRELVDDYKNNKKNNSGFLTRDLYQTLKKLIQEEDKSNEREKEKEKEKENKLNDNNDEINVEEYIERIKVDDMELTSKDRKKVNVYEYQITNYYEDGQIFGMVALESKYGKRSATAISLDDCHLGLLTKEQYNSTLEEVHHKSVELLFNLINSYNILGLAPKKAFDNRFCHMFKCVRYKRGAQIMEENKIINSVIVFNSGEFTITINKNYLELNELITKLQIIRGKMMGLSENEIKKKLSRNIVNNDFIMKQKFILPETMKMYQKKHNLTISIINNKLVIGLLDTVDKDTHLPLFNCTCISESCDGYEISNNSLELVNKEYPCNNNNNKISLINVEYFLKRLQLHAKEIESKIENFNKNLKFELMPKGSTKNININLNKYNETQNDKMIIIENNKNEINNDNIEIRRNSFYKKKKDNNIMSLVQLLGKSLKSDYDTLKKHRFNTIDIKHNDSNSNINIDNKKNENSKITNEETIEVKKNRNLSYFSKIRRSIKRKEKLLKLAQGKSFKYIEKKKAEMRSLNVKKKQGYKSDEYNDLSKFFSNRNYSSKDKENKEREEVTKSPKKIDFFLDNMISKIHKESKYERILSSYISSNKGEKNKIFSINTNEEEGCIGKNELKSIEKQNSEIINNKYDDKGKIEIEEYNRINYQKLKNKSIRSLSDIKKNSISNLTTKENLNNLPNTNDKPINANILYKIDKNKDKVTYPVIKSKLRNLLYDVCSHNESKNVITINSPHSLRHKEVLNSRSNIIKSKKPNKSLNYNFRMPKKLLELKKGDSFGVEKKEIKYNKLPSIISVYSKKDVHFVDPLVLDKFNENYFNKKFKTLEK